jgi:hypothetical protein
MEAAWIVLGGLISTISGIVFWFLNSRTSREVQVRQQAHELAIQQQRVEADRNSRRDDAIRAARRARLEPVFALLAELEAGYSHSVWRDAWQHLEKDGVLDNATGDAGEGLFPDGVPAQIRAEVRQKILQTLPEPSVELLAKAVPVIFRIGDKQLRDDLLVCLGALFVSTDTPKRILALSRIHGRLEHYAATVDTAF